MRRQNPLFVLAIEAVAHSNLIHIPVFTAEKDTLAAVFYFNTECTTHFMGKLGRHDRDYLAPPYHADKACAVLKQDAVSAF